MILLTNISSYGTAQSIKQTYDASTNVAFSCADNSNTVV